MDRNRTHYNVTGDAENRLRARVLGGVIDAAKRDYRAISETVQHCEFDDWPSLE